MGSSTISPPAARTVGIGTTGADRIGSPADEAARPAASSANLRAPAMPSAVRSARVSLRGFSPADGAAISTPAIPLVLGTFVLEIPPIGIAGGGPNASPARFVKRPK